MSTSLDHATALVSRLRASLDGQVVTPDHTDYDTARTVFPGGIDRRPAAIVRVTDSAQTARVVSDVRDAGVELAVRSGGHSTAGHSVSDGGVVIDLSAMRGLEIDPGRRVAHAQGGLTAGEYTAAAGTYGLATGFGDTGSVGIGGITLGGGIGYLSRKHGLTIDDLLAAEVVTADGQVLETDAETHPDLFWAIRGGGGNFGVVTRFTYRLHELSTVVGGILMLPATADVIRGFIAEAQFAPAELSMMVNVMLAPPMPFVPAEYHGTPVVMALMCYAGSAEAGKRAIAPFRALGKPIADMVEPKPYSQMFPPEEAGFHPIAVGHSMFLDDVGDAAAELILDRLHASTASMATAQFRVQGGAIGRVPADATAYAHRHRGLMVLVAAIYQQPAETARHEAWVSELASELGDGSAGAYVNFLGDEGEARVREAYPGPTWERLREVKGRYDPDNLFRLNQNIPPAVLS